MFNGVLTLLFSRKIVILQLRTEVSFFKFEYDGKTLFIPTLLNSFNNNGSNRKPLANENRRQYGVASNKRLAS